jgi:hypothetical protein
LPSGFGMLACTAVVLAVSGTAVLVRITFFGSVHVEPARRCLSGKSLTHRFRPALTQRTPHALLSHLLIFIRIVHVVSLLMKATLVFSALVCLGGASTVFAARFPEVGTLPRKELHFGSQRIFSGLSGSEQGLHISQEDVPLPDATAAALRTRPTTVSRPRSPELVQEARWMSMRDAQSMPVEWDTVAVNGPDVEDRYTLSQVSGPALNAALEEKKRRD